jgi:spermidine dehydrogenase
MDPRDRRLGMDRAITRRDFLNGVSVAIGASLMPACSRTGEPIVDGRSAYYPPAETGLRGSHAGSFEVAHAAIKGKRWAAEKTDEKYDLIVGGAGISGLSAAYIYRRDVDPHARILVLDNHDDFGGHAKRNEFTIDGRLLLGFGGTMFMEQSKSYPAVAQQVINELGIDVDRIGEFYNEDLFASLGVGAGSFFDRETFGVDYLAIGGYGFNQAISKAPLSASAKEELERLYADEEDYLAGMTTAERRAVIESHGWRAYLQKFGGFGEEVLSYVQKWPHGVWAIGADAAPASLAWGEGYPGFANMDLGYGEEENNYEAGGNFYYPDGNASIARLLVRKMIPGTAPGNTMADIVAARFDYSMLDRVSNTTRIRLSSTVVDVRHRNGDLAADVEVTYVNNNEARTATAKKVVWAGYHTMLPHICPDLPKSQVAAMRSSVRAPLVYMSVLVRNWRSFVELGLRRAYCPGSFFHTVMLNRPVSMGEYQYSPSPDEPAVLHLQHIPLAPGLSAPEQFRAGRRALLEMSFETFERNVRDQLDRVLGPGGFNSARDIAAITVNRWPHGYAYSVDAESGDVAWSPASWQHEHRPWVAARQSFGNIVIAGTDASSNAMTESAIEEAHRAVHELM